MSACTGCYPATYEYTCKECGTVRTAYYVHDRNGYHTDTATTCPDCRDSVEYRAKQAAGNHRRFNSFAWFARPEDSDLWALEYVSNRDSDALTRSNARIIARRMSPFVEDGTAREESHGHWACGHVDGYAVRVYTDESRTVITEAFREWLRIADEMADYPVLDEEDFSREETEEAERVWTTCYSARERVEYIRAHRDEFEFQSFADLRACVRGEYFGGYASELLA